MEIQQDFRDLLKLFNSNKVEYIIVGRKKDLADIEALDEKEWPLMTITLKWFPPSWIQIKIDKKIIYIDPAYLRTYYTRYPL